MAKLTQEKRTGRPPGSRDKKKRKTPGTQKSRSNAAKKAAETRRRNKEQREAKLRPAIERPGAVEYSDVVVSDYPRAGDDPNFEKFVADQKRSFEQAEREPVKDERLQLKASGELLKVQDVSEWCAWPFMLWAQSQQLTTLKLTDNEALELAEPLTSILNRHGVADVIPPDILDGLKFAARLTPVMTERLSQIKRERQRRAGQGGPENPNARAHGGARDVQGAPVPAPKEV